MNRDIFIDTLRRSLYGKIDDYTLADHVQYYENYIAQEMSGGRSEQEVLEELGDPRLIARTILEAAEAKTSYKEYTVVEESGDEWNTEAGDMQIHQFQGWKAALIAGGVLLVLVLILILAFHVIAALLPLLIVGGIIVWLAKKIWF